MKTENDKYAQMGRAALIPGLQLAQEILERALSDIRGELAEMQNGDAPMKQRGRPLKTDQTQAGAPLKTIGKGSAWAKMTAAERSREMKRRQAVARANRSAKEQAAFEAERKARYSVAAKKRWAAMSKTQQKARMAHMVAAKAKKPSVKLVNGSAA